MEEQTTNSDSVESRVVYTWEIIENLHCENEECSKKFNNMLTFMQHVTTHGCKAVIVGQDFKLKCAWKGCVATLYDAFSMLRHMLFHAHHTRLKLQGSNYIKKMKLRADICKMAPYVIPDVSQYFMCKWKTCKGLFDSVEVYYRHMEKHAQDNPKGNNLEERVSCYWDDCTMKFGSLYKLRDHLRSHTKEKVIACPVCGTMFASRSKFFDHMKRQEDTSKGADVDDAPVVCGYCNKSFATERLLKQHEEGHINHLKCPKCEMTTRNVATLKFHISFRHSEERNFACSFCSYKAKSKADLTKHVLSHDANIKPFKCVKCSYSAKTRRILRYHIKNKHKECELARYYCHLCDKNYVEGHYLSIHLSKKHNLKWPPGFSRFRFEKGADNKYRLKTTRLEVLEMNQPSLDKIMDSAAACGLTSKSQSNVVGVSEKTGESSSSLTTTLKSDNFILISSSDVEKCVSILKTNKDGSVDLKVSGEIIAEG